MRNQASALRFIRETEMALQMSNVAIGSSFVKLHKPEFRNGAHRAIVENQAQGIVESAVNRWFLDALEEDEDDEEEQEVALAWISRSSVSSPKGKRPEMVETSSPLPSRHSLRDLLIQGEV
tara:strand:- start:651 stop:1013 length:363 start_codon:yes stop_codon:yes gene_type:complete